MRWVVTFWTCFTFCVACVIAVFFGHIGFTIPALLFFTGQLASLGKALAIYRE